jgi:hypothetical protein
VDRMLLHALRQLTNKICTPQKVWQKTGSHSAASAFVSLFTFSDQHDIINSTTAITINFDHKFSTGSAGRISNTSSSPSLNVSGYFKMTQSSNDISKIQADTKGRSDYEYFVTPDNKYSIYFSNIDEYGMMKFVSSVQIWTDKENPRLIFQSRKIQFEYQHGESCYYPEKSDVIVLFMPCVHEKYFDLPYVSFDFNKSAFALINAPKFRLTELEKGIIRQDIDFRYFYDEDIKIQISQDDGKILELTSLEWHDIKLIDKAFSFVTKNNR